MKYLIGGQRMVELGSDRSTNDLDYLVNVKGQKLFTSDANGNDEINADANPFYLEIWNAAQVDGITPKLMFEMKCYSFVQHCQNRNFNKVATTEYDMRRLYLDHDVNSAPIAKKNMTSAEYNECINVLKF